MFSSRHSYRSPLKRDKIFKHVSGLSKSCTNENYSAFPRPPII